MHKTLIYIFLIFTVLVSCDNTSINPEDITRSKLKEPLIRVNKGLVKKDIDKIYSFAKRRKWSLKESKTGLYYDIYHRNNNDSVKTGQEVSLKYKLSLLDGTVCYNSDSIGLKTFTIGKGEAENGLEQGLLMMKYGEKARLILPPHLAFGLLGDDNKIPMRSIIVYQLEIVD